MRGRWILGIMMSFFIVSWAVSSAQAQADFYQGKAITIVIGAKGGSLTVAAQIVAHHIGKYIPGKPTAVVQHMPGAAHLLATNHVFNIAKPDGLTLLAVNPNVGVAQLSKVEAVRFDLRRFQWLGSTGADGVAFSIRADLPYKTLDDLRKSGREIIAGTTGPGSNAHDMPLLLKEFAGLKIKLLPGYPASSDILLALERKEVDSWSAFSTTVQRAVERGAVRALVRSRVPSPGFEQLPVDEELATNPIGKGIMAIRGIPQAIGRGFAAPPGTPPDRVAILRDALAKVLNDPEFRAEAKKAKIHMRHISADQVSKDFAALFDQPAEVLREMGKYIKAGD